MFDRLTINAKRSMTLAWNAAQGLGQRSIGPEHMLLGLLLLEDCAAKSILGQLGVSTTQLRTDVEQSLMTGPRLPVEIEIPFTPEARHAMELSMNEPERLGHTALDTDHFLLGLIRCEDSIAAPALLRVGVTLDAARALAIERKGWLRLTPGE